MKPIARWSLTLVVIAALVVDVFVHFNDASQFVGLPSPSFITQYGLFIFEGCLAIVAGVALLVRADRLTAGFAALVMIGGAFAVWFYNEYDPGQLLGILPDMVDKDWHSAPYKILSFVAELVGGVAALGLVFVLPKRRTAGQLLHRKSTAPA
ncbi:hypothetical protein [Jatrophihabitans sp.]|uniref:hypothetical protein n=1 Tax=Jatrophihabitans sp. TaxID=1932789 RepID=UPI0030C6E862|nr:hypothetical protein [Jatrophihabitans sp.]